MRCRALSSTRNDGSPTPGGWPGAGHCAHHPWRVIGSWLGVFVVLIGSERRLPRQADQRLQDPGPDIQKATDLINAKFGAPEGRRASGRHRRAGRESGSTRPSRQAAIAQDARPPAPPRSDARRGPDQDVAAIADPLASELDQRLRERPRSRTSTSSTTRPASSCRAAASSTLEDQLRSIGEHGGHPGRVHRGGGERAADDQGSATSSACSPAFVILMVLFRALGADRDPAAVRDRGGARRRSCCCSWRPG